MSTQLPLRECSIADIYLRSSNALTYTIPIYQRNYAWRYDEINALVNDIRDSFVNHPGSPYYLGTLVTFKRDSGVYEVIDGQQRLTTLYLLIKAFGITEPLNRLTFTARHASANAIEHVGEHEIFDGDLDAGIVEGYKIARKAVAELGDLANDSSFKAYFLNNVKIIHYHVPKDVDLNHYFEVMNSRGEQLEKHEIVKSLLTQALNDEGDRAKFARIWEACSDMNRYVQLNLDDKNIFGNQLKTLAVSTFNDIPEINDTLKSQSIRSLLDGPIAELTVQNRADANDRFQSIIDFPNFLLTVLKLTLIRTYGPRAISITLDDKELLTQFESVLSHVGDKDRFAKTYTYNLLKARYLLDNYVVHHAASDFEQPGDNPWQLEVMGIESSGKRYPTNLCREDEKQIELVHLLSMFEVTFTAKQRKNYLLYTLLHLFGDQDPERYLDFMRDLADKYFYDVYLNRSALNAQNQPGPNAFDDALLPENVLNTEVANIDVDIMQAFNEIYTPGRADVPLYVFNYTDYKLWVKYADEVRGQRLKVGSDDRRRFFEQLGCSDFGLEAFNTFYFSRTRRSLEHFYPQAKAVPDGMEDDAHLSVSQINDFGNFAMISAQINSAGKDLDPKSKIDRYTDRREDAVSVASLKFKIMMQICRDNRHALDEGILPRPIGMEWNYADITAHRQAMLRVLQGEF